MKKITLFAALMLMSLLGNAQVDLYNGLIAYYPFNGNANDASGNGHNATVNGATLTEDRFGNANSCYSLYDGGNGINITSSVSYNFDNDFSYNFWVQSFTNNGQPFYWGSNNGCQFSWTNIFFDNGTINSTFMEERASFCGFCQDVFENNGGTPLGFF